MMTLQDVKETVADIKRMAETDVEAAHGLEDSLYESFVRLIANGPRQRPAAEAVLAAEILKTKNLAFARHCA